MSTLSYAKEKLFNTATGPITKEEVCPNCGAPIVCCFEQKPGASYPFTEEDFILVPDRNYKCGTLARELFKGDGRLQTWACKTIEDLKKAIKE